MLNTIDTVAAVALGLHVLVKFAFFVLPYRRRRALLDKQYGDTSRMRRGGRGPNC